MLRRLRLGNAERSPQGREGGCSQAPLPGNATSESSFNTRTALEISNLNPQRESEPAPGRMLICTPLSAVVSPPAANPPRGAANRTGRSAAERPRHACRRRPGAARRGSPVKYSVASRSPPCVGFTVGALHPARLEPTRGCRSQLQRNAVASDSESACASTTTVHRSKEDALSPSLRRANCAWFITRL